MLKHICCLLGMPRWLSFGVCFVFWKSVIFGFLGHAQFQEIAFLLSFAHTRSETLIFGGQDGGILEFGVGFGVAVEWYQTWGFGIESLRILVLALGHTGYRFGMALFGIQVLALARSQQHTVEALAKCETQMRMRMRKGNFQVVRVRVRECAS